MKYVIGVDGGGSKTACVLADETGNVVSAVRGKGSNHQICGIKEAVNVVNELINFVVQDAGIKMNDIAFVGMGLAGADLEQDIVLLNKEFSKTLGKIPFKIVNDIWIAFWAATRKKWGAVSVCGTGSNTGVRTPRGKVYKVRALKYPLGNYGGGNHLSDIAMHYAFRSSEQTGDYTELEKYMPSFCNVSNMNELAMKIYESEYTYHHQYNIPVLVFDLAQKGDEVSRKILSDMGFEMGRMTAGLIESAKLSDTANIPVVLAGSLYVNDINGFIINSFKKALNQRVKSYKIQVLRHPPVCGAIFLSYEEIKIKVNEKIVNDIAKGLVEYL